MGASTIVLITGANSGVGYATAKMIATASPEYHILIGSRDITKGEKACTDLKQTAGVQAEISPLQIDVNNGASRDNAVSQINQKFGKLDVLINNAGVYFTQESREEELRKTFETNIIGATLVSEAFFPLLEKSSNAYLLNVSSGLGSIEQAKDPKIHSYKLDGLGYRQSKAALNMLTVQQDKFWGPKGIKAFSVCPGLVVSNLRGTEEAQRTAGGVAQDADTSGKFFLSVIQGKRDKDVGMFINAQGRLPW